jgi:transcriptional regulator with XRE-family HTH domain
MTQRFGQLLKDWRSKRRVSQLALGLKANVSSRHVAFLETGRARPSRTMVMQLADALDVPIAAQNGLLDAAGFSAAYVRRSLDDASMAAVRASIDWSLARHHPYPAFAKDQHWNLVAANPVASLMLKAVAVDIGTSLFNILADESQLTSIFANPGEVGRHVLQRLRLESAYLGGDAHLESAAQKLATMDIVKSYEPPAVLPPFVPAIYQMQGQQLAFFSTLAQFGTAEDLMLADLQIEFLFPADDATRQTIEQIAHTLSSP